MPAEVTAALERAYREERAKVLATLTRHVGGDLGLAEDVVQDAFVAAAAAAGVVAAAQPAQQLPLRRAARSPICWASRSSVCWACCCARPTSPSPPPSSA